MGGFSVADLVVEDDGDVVGGIQVGEGEEVFVAGAGAAVEGDEGGFAGGEGADDFVPGVAGFV